MRLVTTNGFTEIQIVCGIIMSMSDADPCEPRDMLNVSATSLDGQSALFFHDSSYTRGAWVCKDTSNDSYLLLFQARDTDELVDSAFKRPILGRALHANAAGPHGACSMIMAYVLNGSLPSRLNSGTLQRLNTSVKKAAS